jgi:uncharacterized integral membrane protein
MKIIINLISSSFLAGWIITMAVFSIQNINPVVLRFFTWESLKLPIGVLLAFCVGLGLVLGSLLPLLLPKPKKYPRQRLSDVDIEDMEEFNF